MKHERQSSPADHLIGQIDQGLRTLFGKPDTTERSNPARDVPETALSDSERELAARLMRINHAGEVAAQALYQGQALTARNSDVKKQMERSAKEENDHLDWCETRIRELGGHTSLLNPLWYTGSLAIGAMAGLAGDKWSLGFVVETEKQVEAHLEEHQAQIDQQDQKTHAILQQMKEDEIHHAATASHAGGAELPPPVKAWMKLTSKIMTKSTYWV